MRGGIREGWKQRSIMLKYVPSPPRSIGPRRATVVWLPCLLGSLQLRPEPHYVWQRSEGAGRRWNERKGGREGGRAEAGKTEIGPSPPPDIADESTDAVLCTFSADPAREEVGMEGGGKYSASCLWQGS